MPLYKVSLLSVGLHNSEDKYALTTLKTHVLAVLILVFHTVLVTFSVFSSVWFSTISTLLYYMLAYHFYVYVCILSCDYSTKGHALSLKWTQSSRLKLHAVL